MTGFQGAGPFGVTRAGASSLRRVRRRQKARNLAQGALLLGGMVTLAAGLTWLLFGGRALLPVLVAGVVAGLLGSGVSPRWVLRAQGAQPLPRSAAPWLHGIVDELADQAGLDRTPALYYVPTQVPNAFAVGGGRDAALGVTAGLLRALDRRELAGVLAHEVSHVRNGDTSIMAVASLLGRLVHALVQVGLWSVFLTLPLTIGTGPAPLLVSGVLVVVPALISVLQMGLSRSRERDADLDAAFLTGDPHGLASGLLTLERVHQWSMRGPFGLGRGQRQPPPLLRSHPDTPERVRRLQRLAVSPTWSDDREVAAS